VDALQQAWEKLRGTDELPFASTSPKQGPPGQQAHPQPSPLQQLSDNFTNIPPRRTASRRSSRSRLIAEAQLATVRAKHESPSADWLGEADRLGREGWESLRKAEEAWSSTMESLRHLANQSLPSTAQQFEPNGDVVQPSSRQDETAGTDRTVRAGVRSRHESFDLSYPRQMNRVEQLTQNSPSPLTQAVVMPERASDDLAITGRLLSPPRGTGYYDRPIPKQAPVPLSPLPFDELGGYTQDYLGFDDAGDETIRRRPQSYAAISTTSAPRGTHGRKLSKARPAQAAMGIPSAFRQTHEPPPSSFGDKIQGQNGSVRGSLRGSNSIEGSMGKRHWWSRMRSGSVTK
jgi:hypothetical protein